MKALPLFLQLGKKNYFAESLCHIVNFTAKWPLAVREMMRQNCSVNLSGNVGHNIPLDEYIETYIVKPLKAYASGHTSFHVLQKLSVLLPLLETVRQAYKGKSGFDRHHTKKHSTPSSTEEICRTVSFCLRNNFFEVDSRTQVKFYPHIGSSGTVIIPSRLLQVEEKGLKKFKEVFSKRMFELYPECRDNSK